MMKLNERKLNEIYNHETVRKIRGYKTGHFIAWRNEQQAQLAADHGCDCLGAGIVEIDWFRTRNSERKPIIRVKWHFPTYATRKTYKDGYCIYKKTWECTSKEQRFPFTVEGFEAAIEFAESL